MSSTPFPNIGFCPCTADFFHSSSSTSPTPTPLVSYSIPPNTQLYVKYDVSTNSIQQVRSNTPGAILLQNPYNRPVLVSYHLASQQFCLFSGC